MAEQKFYGENSNNQPTYGCPICREVFFDKKKATDHFKGHTEKEALPSESK